MTVQDLYDYMKDRHPGLNEKAFLVMLNKILRQISKRTKIYSYSMSTSTAVGQREYELSDDVIEVYRVDYDGDKIDPISESQIKTTDIS